MYMISESENQRIYLISKTEPKWLLFFFDPPLHILIIWALCFAYTAQIFIKLTDKKIKQKKIKKINK